MAVPARTEPTQYSWRRRVLLTAGPGKRGLALGVDLIVVAVLTYVTTYGLTASRVLALPRVNLASGLGSEALGFLWLVSLLELPVALAYFTLFEGASGRTLGKLVTGLRVVSLDGGRVTVFDAFLRNLLRLLWVTPFGLAFVFLDAYVIQTTEMDQRIGDLAAGTIVLDEAARL